MSCNVSSGIALGCRDVVGGVQNIWITDQTNLLSITKSTGDTITQISGTGSYYEFQLIRTSSQFTETINASLENGTVFYTQELVTYFAKLEQSKRNIVKTLAQSTQLSIVMEDNNGRYWLLGEIYGCYISAGSGLTGKSLGDQNGYNLTFQALEQNPMCELSGPLTSVVAGITVVPA